MLTVVSGDLCNESIRASVIIVKWLKKLGFVCAHVCVCVSKAHEAPTHADRTAVCDVYINKEGVWSYEE